MIQFAASQLTANVTQGTATVVIDRVGNLGASVTVNLSSPGDPTSPRSTRRSRSGPT